MNKLVYTILLGCILANCQAQLQTCETEFLTDTFIAALNYRCIVARITSINNIYHTTQYTEGCIIKTHTYYNIDRIDSLQNVNRPENLFPSVSSTDLTCVNGKEQPFSVVNLKYNAQNAFDITINRTGYVTFKTNDVIVNEFSTTCYSNYSVGLDAAGVLHVVELRALPIEQACPTYFGKSCLGVAPTNSCLPTQIYTGGQCYYRSCSDIDCGNHVCISNGGVARCIESTIAPTETKKRMNKW